MSRRKGRLTAYSTSTVGKRRPTDKQLHGLWQKNAREAMKRWATKRGVACFKCGSTTNDWAKTGISRRGAWGICVPCIEKKQADTSSP